MVFKLGRITVFTTPPYNVPRLVGVTFKPAP